LKIKNDGIGLEHQELMKFKQEAPICTWMSDQLMKKNLEIQICKFSKFALRICFEII
jgi:hypothetical protein